MKLWRAREGPVFFHMFRCVFSNMSEVPGGFSDLWKILVFQHVDRKKSTMRQIL